jgi:dihydrolipoamide dehydrogenase
MATEVKVPDIGDFTDVPVIEVLVSPGDEVEADEGLVTLESDKATMDVPAPEAGVIEEVLVEVGDKVSEGTAIAKMSSGNGGDEGGGGGDEAKDEDEDEGEEAEQDGDEGENAEEGEKAEAAPSAEEKAGRVVVIGSGPGGYTAAFRAADLGLDVVLVERFDVLGGICLNVGCIPSKTLLHAAEVIAAAEDASGFGVTFGEPEIDLGRLREWKDEVVGKLTGGLQGLSKQRKVRVVTGEAKFTGPNEIDVDGTTIDFTHCIIAAGSRPIELPGFPEDERVIDSTGALEIADVPERLLVVGGGIIGLEMATVYYALGSKVSVVEMTPQLVPGCDPDLVKPLQARIEPRYEAIMLETKVSEVKATEKGLEASFEGESAPAAQVYDKILVAAGRRANGDRLDLGPSGVEAGDDGVIEVDDRQRTNVPHIFAIGDVTGGPMLAHKATYEGVVAAEVIAGEDVRFDAQSIPSVAYTDPEIAWTGLTETDAKEGGIDYEVAKLNWGASARAMGIGRTDGLTKLLVDPESRRILGAGITGVNAGELIAELTLAIELGANATDVGLTIHPHPTLSETVTFAAEVAEGVVTDIYAPKRKRKKKG